MLFFFVRASYSIFNAAKTLLVFMRATQTLIPGQGIVLPVSSMRKGMGRHVRGLLQVKRRDFETATWATTGVGVVCQAHFKRKDYPPVICLCKIHNLLLKSNVSLRISAWQRQLAKITAASADTEAFGSLYQQPTG